MFNNVGQVDVLQSIALAMLLYILGLMFVLFSKGDNKPILVKLFSLAFLVRVISLYGIYYYLISIGDDGYAIRDDWYYDQVANEISRELKKGHEGFIEYGIGIVNIGYFNFNGWLYYYLGFDTLSARMVNVFFSSITVVLFYRIAQTLFDNKRAYIVGMTIVLLPNLIFWASLQFKDSIIIFASTALIYIMICKFRHRITLFPLLFYALFMFVLWHFRKDYCFPLIAVGLLWLLIKYTMLGVIFDSNKTPGFVKYLVLLVSGAILLVSMLLTSAGNVFVGNMEFYTDAQSELASSGVGFTRFLRITSPADIYKLPAAVAFTAIAPLPSFDSLTKPDMAGFGIQSVANLFLIFFMPFIVLGFFMVKGEKIQFTDELLIKWLPLMTLLMLSVLYMGNLRYKSTLLVYFACWGALAFYERKKLKTKLLIIYFLSVILIFFVTVFATIIR